MNFKYCDIWYMDSTGTSATGSANVRGALRLNDQTRGHACVWLGVIIL